MLYSVYGVILQKNKKPERKKVFGKEWSEW